MFPAAPSGSYVESASHRSVTSAWTIHPEPAMSEAPENTQLGRHEQAGLFREGQSSNEQRHGEADASMQWRTAN